MAESAGGFESIAVIPTDFVREQLRRTMVMGLPDDPVERPTFYFEPVTEFEFEDAEGSPWDWTATPVDQSQRPPIQVICAYEFFAPLGRQGTADTEPGEFNPSTIVVTMFEEEFEQVKGFSYVTIGPSTQRWYVKYARPANALNDMTVYQVHCQISGVP